jgi:hypothetical protein
MTEENKTPENAVKPISAPAPDLPPTAAPLRQKILPDGSAYERPSERMFRRSRRAEDRRRKQARDDANFFKAVFSLAGVATAFVFILIFLASSSMSDGGGGLASLAPLSEPWLGPVSKLELFGGLFIGLLAAVYLWRIRKR